MLTPQQIYKYEQMIERAQTVRTQYETQSKKLALYEITLDGLNKAILKREEESILLLQAEINKALEFIFFDQSISIEFEPSKSGYNLLINSNGSTGKIDSVGGGVLAIISFIIYLFFHKLTSNTGLLVLDETFTFVSIHYQERLSKFLQQIAEDYNFDILLVSHQELLNTHAQNKIQIN